MKAPVLAAASAAALLLCSCDPAAVDVPSNAAENVNLNAASTASEPPIPQTEPAGDSAPVLTSGSADQEPRMTEPEPTTTPPGKSPVRPPAKVPATPPRRVILPSPTQPPAEIDPVLPDPGDEVPR